MQNAKLINYGAGWSAPNGWLNFDASPTLIFERIPLIGSLYTKNKLRFPANVQYGDIVKGLPLMKNSSDLIYCSHVLEHLSLKDLKVALHNTYEILKPGGIFRCVLPDLKYLAIQYIKSSDDPNAAANFMIHSGLGLISRDRGVLSIFKTLLGNSNHLWMWDYNSLRSELLSVGFNDIRRAYFDDSLDIRFKQVEEFGRWENCLGIECIK